MISQYSTPWQGGVTAPAGFTAGGIHCGVRRRRKDLAIILSDTPAATAGVFTTNRVQAAPVLVTKAQLRKGEGCARAIVINSGNANACTGERGLGDAWAMAAATAASLGLSDHEALVSSTGVIGQFLPIEKLLVGIDALAPRLTPNGSPDAAEAIMTTDTHSKQSAVRLELTTGTIYLGAIGKGSGMVAPNMATTLAFVTTDANLSVDVLNEALRYANERSFNRLTVDGDTSTNDMILVMANGRAGLPQIALDSEDYIRFRDALEGLLVQIARMVARDGEGATKLIEVHVGGAADEATAAAAARSIANSNLVKTAIHGGDANWGRIIAAVGYSGVEFDPERVEIRLNGVPVLASGYRIVIDEDAAAAALKLDTVFVDVLLGQGTAEATFYTCDLTKEYVHINASYRS